MSGCAVCVHDLYAESLESYTKAMDDLREALRRQGVSEKEWPKQILPRVKDAKEDKRGTLLSAFEQLELKLAKKKDEETPVGQLRSRPSATRNGGPLTSQAIARPPGGPSTSTKFLDMKDMWNALSWILFSRR